MGQVGQVVQGEQEAHVVGRGEGSWQTVKAEQREKGLQVEHNCQAVQGEQMVHGVEREEG